MEKNSVLLVDDNKVTNFYNRWMVSNHGMFGDVHAVCSGLAALEYINNLSAKGLSSPEFIFLDINMPAMNGWEFLEELNKLDETIIKDIYIIILSTTSHEDDIDRAEQNPLVRGFINKPLNKRDLNMVLESYFLFRSKIKKIDLDNTSF